MAIDQGAIKEAARLKLVAEREKGVTVATSNGAMVLSEDSMALAFADEYRGRLVYAHKLAAWYIYDNTTGIWRRDETELVSHWVRDFTRALNTEQKSKWAKGAVISSVERMLRRDPGLAITGDKLDANNWLLGTPEGVIDLSTGAAVQPSPDHYITKSTAVAPKKGPPDRFLKFLDDTTGNSADMIGYLQRLFGVCLTGETREEFMAFFHGGGGNGKSVLMNTVREIMGGYARQASMQVFLSGSGDRHPTELANLFGARLVLASESPEGRKWDEERIKSLTGRDAISARFMNRDFFEFVPKFKLIVASNHKPRIRTVDDAWRRRLHLVPFTRKPANPDPYLKDKLRAEYPQILQWMIEGAEWWAREGLAPPDEVLAATEEYFKEEDVIGLWFGECCELDLANYIERKDLYQSYETWCRGMGHAAATMHAVTRWLKQNGFEQDTAKATRPLIGVRLK